VLIVVATLLAMGRVIGNDFVRFDDAYTIHQNPRLNPPTVGSVLSYWRDWRSGADGLYVPVTYTAWAALATLARLDQPDAEGIALNPYVFHAASVLVHVAAALVVFELLTLLVRNRVAAAIGALVFALHPVQVEPVAWASGLKDVLAGALALLAIWLYLSPVRSGWRYVLATACFVLAMLSKPSAMMAAPIALVLDVMLIRRPLWSSVRWLLPWVVLAIPVALIARHVQAVTLVQPVPLHLRPLIAGDALTFYLRQIALPVNLALDYGRRPDVVLASRLTYFLWVVPVLLALLTWRLRSRPLQGAVLLFLLALLPVLGFTPFQFQHFSTVADHYLYLAMFGVALAVASLIASRPSPVVVRVAAVVLALLAIRTIVQAGYWRDDAALFTHTLAVNPRSFLAHNNLGEALESANRLPEALDHYQRAIELYPEYPGARANAARVSARLGMKVTSQP
jgi:hypothetical protein